MSEPVRLYRLVLDLTSEELTELAVAVNLHRMGFYDWPIGSPRSRTDMNPTAAVAESVWEKVDAVNFLARTGRGPRPGRRRWWWSGRRQHV